MVLNVCGEANYFSFTNIPNWYHKIHSSHTSVLIAKIELKKKFKLINAIINLCQIWKIKWQ